MTPLRATGLGIYSMALNAIAICKAAKLNSLDGPQYTLV
jgi:hypothetical protein